MKPRLPWGGCDLRNRRHVRGLLAGPAGWCHMQTKKKLPRPWGLRTAKLPLVSVAPGKPSRLLPHANQNEASPSLGIANCETVATFGSSWEEWCHTRARMRPRRPWGPRTVKLTPLSGARGRPNAVASDANQKEASPSLGAANCQTVVTFGSSWEAQRSGVTRRPQ